jgi:signal transduction histidine kinase/DNA-binding NtrC family response regulator/class 3 adenylate cyclase
MSKFIEEAFIYKKTKLILVLLCIISLGSCTKAQKTIPKIKDGVLDLRDWDFKKDGKLTVHGKWMFWWKKFIDPSVFQDKIQPVPETFQTSTRWKGKTSSKEKGSKLPSYGYATYSFKIIFPKNLKKISMLYASHPSKSYLVNKNKITKINNRGIPSKKRSGENYFFKRKIDQIEIGNEKSNYLVVHLSSHHFHGGGEIKLLQIGKLEELQNTNKRDLVLKAVISTILIIMGLYNLILYFFIREDKASLYFSLLCLGVALYEIGQYYLITNILDINFYFSECKMIYIGLYTAMPMLTQYLTQLFPGNWYKKFSFLYLIMFNVLLIITVLTPYYIYSKTLNLFSFLALIGIILSIILISINLKSRGTAKVLIFSFIIVFITAIQNILEGMGVIQLGVYLVSYGILFLILCNALIITKRNANSYYKAKDLTINLEEKVQSQTRAALKAKEEAEALKEEALNQNVKLLELDKQKTMFFQNISHELRTPLTLIMNPLSSLNEDMPEEERVIVAKENSTRLYRLVNQLLDFEKITAGKNQLELRPINLVTFLNTCAKMFKPSTKNKNISFFYKVNGRDFNKDIAPIYIQAEVDALEKIIFNFLSNALKYSPEDSSILLGLSCYESNVKISVKDNGKGISEKNQSKLFEVFSQVDSTTTREYEGTGLGLALVKNLAIEMNAQVGVESEISKGSTFYVEFKQYTKKLAPLDLMIVEDEIDLLDTYKEFFEKSKKLKRISYCMNASEAREVLKENTVKCIMSDAIMPGEDGVNLLKFVHQEYPKTKKIIITGQASDEMLEDAVNIAKVDLVLRKPISNLKLFDLLGKMIRESLVKEEKEVFTEDLADLLVVDDDEAVLESYQMIFDESKLNNVFYAKNAEEAKEILKEKEFKCIISDARMPGEDGADFLSFVHEYFPETKKLLITGQATDDILKRAVNDGNVDKVLYKPFDSKELKKTIYKLIDESKLNSLNNYTIKDWHLSGSDLSIVDDSDINIELTDLETESKDIILVVDDLKDMRDLITKTLEKNNFKVLKGSNGEIGSEIALKTEPDLIITDWMMPKKSGLDLIKDIRTNEKLKSTPIVLLTAKSDEESKISGAEIGADAFLGKPFNEHELISIVKNLINLKSNEKEVQKLNEHITQNVLKKYLAPEIVDKIIQGEVEFLTEPKHMDITIMFTDLTGFTKLSSNKKAEDISSILNQYFGSMNQIIFGSQGTIDKYMGDGIMVLFGAPIETSKIDQIENALACANRMRDNLDSLNEIWIKNGIIDIDEKLEMRIGIHSGSVLVGNFGSSLRSDFTAIGNEVNIASRIESLCKSHEIFISEKITEYLKEDEFKSEGLFALKGVNKKIELFSFVGQRNLLDIEES